MTLRRALLLSLVAGALAASATGLWFSRAASEGDPATGPHAPTPVAPAPRALDAAEITTGRLEMKRLPEEVAATLQAHSDEIVKNAEALEAKQERITGTCAPGSAIRVIAADGSVSCQRLPRGVVSVIALAGTPLLATTRTAAASVTGGIGRYQTGGPDDFLVVPVPLPDGVIITSFSYVFWDTSEALDGTAYLYRSDDQPMAAVSTTGAFELVRTASTDQIELRKVDANRYGYFVYFQTSAEAGAALLPISAAVSYRIP